METAENVVRAKSQLRLKARAARRALTPEQRKDAAARVASTILALPELQQAHSFLTYAAMPEEIDPDLAVEGLRLRGARIALPRIIGPARLQLHWHEEGDELLQADFGHREPLASAPHAPVTEIDAVLAPGVAYDPHGRRLGFGGGYYDVLFRQLDPSVIRIGIAFDEQVFQELPYGDNDAPVDMIVTPSRVYRPES
ncbi:MAG: 5-formyltetrahydrofolate cyclo-ligase [Coriobacteriia bacterium]|nr:5-formyltetrahydrofolate cyclo-ligase [Coriobacteriia bacterium]MBN2822227.1 5-formyltetrahydrofolate cyclo-ligase [Coriobacteriia bacterium]